MLFSRPSLRQMMVTLRAWVEKNIAAWPAELPAPTMWTSRPCGVGRLAARGAVRDPLPGELLETGDGQTPPRDTAREDDRARSQAVAAVEMDPARLGVDPGDRPGHEHLRAETTRLPERTTGQLVARDARGKAEIVLDPRRRPGLAAGRLALDHDRAQALRRPVNGRGQPRRPAADDHRVVYGRGRLGAQPQQLGDLARLRPRGGLAVDDANRRTIRFRRAADRPISRRRPARPG